MSTYLDLAERVLRDARKPLTAIQMLRQMYAMELAPSHLHGRTQHKTLQARLSEDILRHRNSSRFYRTAPGKFFLRALMDDPTIPEKERRPIIARRNHYDAIVEGSQSEHFQVREGVAFGLRDIFYDSLDITVIDWLLDERDLEIREKLLEHMAAQSEYSGGYREEVEKAYRDSATGSTLRARLEAACRNTGLAIQLRKIALQTGEPDLYTLISGGTVSNTQNFNAPVNTPHFYHRASARVL
jgi:hypothetical protein